MNHLQEFVIQNAGADTTALRLKYAGKELPFPLDFALLQIEARRKTRTKLSRFLERPDFIFPSDIAAQQSSHQDVAAWHARRAQPGDNVLDMTAGLGIDAMSMSMAGANVTAIELNPHIAETLKHNAALFAPEKMNVINADSIEFLRQHPLQKFDIIFIDPARRDNNMARTYAFADCSPNVAMLAAELLQRCRTLIIKASPMLDVTQALREIPCATEVAAVSIANECKEVMITAGNIACECQMREILFRAVDISRDGSIHEFSFMRRANESSDIATPLIIERPKVGEYLYEPGAAVLKLNCDSELCARFPALRKADVNTQLFISTELYTEFPGRVMKILAIGSRKEMTSTNANVAVRNYPQTAEQLRRTLKATGTDENLFIFGARISGKPTFLLAQRLRT